jgi:predicted DNA-binding transcriptional regulator AlpA
MNSPEYVDVIDMARMLGINPRTLRNRYLAGDIPAYKIGRVLRFVPSEVREAIRAKIEKRPPT